MLCCTYQVAAGVVQILQHVGVVLCTAGKVGTGQAGQPMSLNNSRVMVTMTARESETYTVVVM